MRFLITILFTILLSSLQAQESIIQEFDALVQQMADEVANSDDPVKTQSEWDDKIDKAEIEFEKELEKFIQEEEKRLEKEQKDSENENFDEPKDEDDDNDDDDKDEESNQVWALSDEINWLKENSISAKEIAKRYNKTNPNKNGFSTQQIAMSLGHDGKGSESGMAEYIYTKLN